MATTDIGSVPFWDSYYGETSPQDWTTDGTYLFDDSGTAVAALSDASATAVSSGDTSTMSIISSLVGELPAIITGWNTIQLSNVNVTRAQQGLAPLNMTAYGPQVGVSLTPATQSMLMIGAVGLGAVLLLSRKRA